MRKLSIVPIFLAMMMVTLATVLPHHHHETMICIAEEVCGLDGCIDDAHTHHSDANHNEDESHCVAHNHTSRRKHCMLTTRTTTATKPTYPRSSPLMPTF